MRGAYQMAGEHQHIDGCSSSSKSLLLQLLRMHVRMGVAHAAVCGLAKLVSRVAPVH